MDAAPAPRPRRQLFWLLLALAAAVAAWGFWPRALEVETARVTLGPLTVSFSEEARTRLRDRWLVSAPLDGTVERIPLRPGDVVSAGHTVAVLRPARASLLDPARRTEVQARANAAVQAGIAASAALASAQARHEESLAELDRARALADAQLIARADLDSIRAGAVAADAAVREARAQREAARIEQRAAQAVLALQGSSDTDARVALPAPVDGRVVRRLVESATPVQAGQPLLEVGDPDAIEVVAEVLTADAVRLAPGMLVRLTNWGGDATLLGRVQRVEPGGFTKVSALGVEEQRVLVIVALAARSAAAGKALGDGFRLEAEFVVWHSPRVLGVPTAALFRDGARWSVYAVEDGRARLRHLQLGRMGGDRAELRAGLREGEEVILYPGDEVRDGRRVRAQ